MHIGGSNAFTRSLVTLQFAMSICLIISTLVILQQTNYMRGRNPGFNKENVIVVDAVQTNTKSFSPLLKEQLFSQPGIIGVSAAEGGLAQGSEIGWHGFMYKGTHKSIYEYLIDRDYIKVLGMELIAGRNFTTSITDDTTTSVIINEAMMNNFGWTLKDVIGQQIKGYTKSHTPVVIGVVKDFNFQILTEKIQPQLFYQFGSRRPQKFYVRIKPGNPAPVLASIQKAWKSVVPDAPFKYSFLDEDLDNLYKSEQRWSNIVGCAGGISIFLACLGLFGLAMLASVNRTKEIGIRKVLGASITNIVALISGDFIKLIVIAFLIASPIAWYFMDSWLQSFAYRINIGWLVFALAGIFALAVALVSISFQALKAAVTNPVVSLRTE